MKIYLTAIVKAKESSSAKVLSVLHHMVEETRKEPANELYQLHQDLTEENVFVFYEIWKSAEGLASHNEQPYIKAFADLVNDHLTEPPAIYQTTLIT
ncbi:antibiotic biosynthesis monooxygenase [Terrimonas sp. NA20]|uniref:Antibiotic biosynthesis monooxygenase n=1 Tax=Terrimonas ginsenosidimutans TaxID=2908004 RepID=A0ABS9KUY7_9BACT|nr:putative quinol monooxygenase [Terrimonas ginsenosidimutans]MCG2616097.1 antibiotic biosynthesis monooxygenase [Terrimonas ginsenosidimutans]